MKDLRRVQQSGIEAVETITSLLQRRRLAHPTKGAYEAAELQWWWTTPQRSDALRQLIWLGADGQLEAAAVLFDFSGGPSLVYDDVTFCPFVLPDAGAAFVEEVIAAGLALASDQGIASVELEVAQSDEVTQAVLGRRGFTVKEPDVLVEAWLHAEARPAVSSLPDGYQVSSRAQRTDRPHYIDRPGRGFSEDRLRALSLYRADFDLTVVDSDDIDAGHCLFWYDPVTATGAVEPMRIEGGHQRKGLARHLLTTGIDLLINAGAERIAIGYEPDNPASSHLYRSLGFEDTNRNDLYSGPTS